MLLSYEMGVHILINCFSTTLKPFQMRLLNFVLYCIYDLVSQVSPMWYLKMYTWWKSSFFLAPQSHFSLQVFHHDGEWSPPGVLVRKKDHSLQRILRCHSVETTPVQVLMVDSFIYIFSAPALIICHFHFYFDYFGSVNPSMVTRLHGIFYSVPCFTYPK